MKKLLFICFTAVLAVVQSVYAQSTVTVESPNGGETLVAGENVNITWATGGSPVMLVDLYYSTDLGATWNMIIDAQSNTGSFEWTVPSTPTTEGLVRVVNTNNSNEEDESNGAFTISSATNSLTLTYPNGGETVNVGDTVDITWTHTGNIAMVDLYYSTDGGAQQNMINDNIPNTGSYSWVVPNAPTSMGRIYIVETFSNPVVSDMSNTNFTIAASDGLTLISPNGGENYPTGSTQTITWSSTGSIQYVDFYYSNNGGASWTFITDGEPNDGSYSWTVPSTANNTSRIKVQATNNSSIRDISNANFTISAPAPSSVSLVSPNGGEVWYADSSEYIIWTHNNVSNVKLEYTTNYGSTWNTITNSAVSNPGVGSYLWTVPSVTTSGAKVRVTNVADPSVTDESNNYFTIGTPSITVAYPNGGETFYTGAGSYISWSASYVQNVKIEYSGDNGSTWSTVIASYPANNGYYSWTIPSTPTSQARIRISDVSATGVADESNSNFSIIAPSYTITSPNGGESFTANTYNYIYWSSNGTSSYVNLYYSTNGGSTWNLITNGYYNQGYYNWYVPNSPSNTALIKIEDYYNNSIIDISDAAFTIAPVPPSINVSSPYQGQVLTAGATDKYVSWTSVNVDSVYIEFTPNGGTTWDTLSHGYPAATQYFSWAPIPSINTNNGYVRVSLKSDPSVNDVNGPFTIVVPEIVVESPIGGEVLTGGTYQTISWNATGLSNYYVNIQYSTDSGATWNNIYNYYYNGNNTYSWQVPNLSSQEALIKVSDSYVSTVYDMSDAVFTILPTPPSITVNTPNGGQQWAAGSGQTIYWSSVNVDSVMIEFSNDGGNTWSVITSSTPASNGYYYWNNVTSPATQNAYIRITDITNSSVYDTNNGPFYIVIPSITVTSPNGGETWTGGTYQYIYWNRTNLPSSTVRLHYSTNNGTSWTPIASNVSNNGYYQWQVVNAPTNTARIRVADNNSTNINDISDAAFTILATPPYITLTSPNGYETWAAGSSQTITWNSVNVSTINIEFSADNGATWSTVASNVSASQFSYVWNPVYNFTTNTARIKVTSTANAAVTDMSNNAFTIQVPSITVTSPNCGETWNMGSNQYIQWSAPGVQYVNLDYSTDGGVNWINIANGVNASNGYYYWTVPSTATTQGRVRVRDYNGSVQSDISNCNFTIPTPSITVTSPNGGEIWGANTYKYIYWNSTSVNYVNLQYSTDNGNSWNTIASGVYAYNGYYQWYLPFVNTTNALVRVTDYSNSSYYDQSNSTFTIVQPTFTVTSPNGGESWTGATNQTITWTSTGNSSYVTIDYSTNGGASYTTISSYEYNDGSYTWNVANTPTTSAVIRVRDSYNSNSSDISNSYFTILEAVPYITITYPYGNNTWSVGTTQYIQWSSISVSNVKIEYSLNNGSTYNTIINNTLNNGYYYWTVPNTPSNQVRIRVSDASNSSVSDVTDYPITIPSPSLVLTTPDGGENWGANTGNYIYWTGTSVPNVKLEYTINNGGTWSLITSSTNGANGYYYWQTPNINSSNVKVRISDVSNASVNDMSNSAFSIVTPTLTVTSPNGGEQYTGGQGYYITWTGTGVSSYVSLSYSPDFGASWYSITSAAYNSGSYYWNAPNMNAQGMLIKVADYYNSSYYDVSNSAFQVQMSAPTITLNSPNGGESLIAGNGYYINFTTNNVSLVKIEYSVNNGTSWTTLSNNTNGASGYYYWVVPNISTTQALVRVSDASTASLNDQSASAFSIIPATSSLSLTYPNGGEMWYAGSYQMVQWSSILVDNVAIYLSTDNGSTWNTLTSSTPAGNGTYYFQVDSSWATTDALVMIESVEDTTISDMSSFSFEINIPVANNNTITLDSLNDSTFCKGEELEVSFTSSGVYNAFNTYTVQLSDENGSFANPMAIGSITSQDTTGNIQAFIPENIMNGNGYRIRVVSSDLPASSASSSETISINSPEFDFTASSYVLYLPDGGIQFMIDDTTGFTDYAWSFGNGDSAYVANPTYNYNEVAKYTIDLTVTNADGCMTTVSKMNYIAVEQIFPNIPLTSGTTSNLYGVSFLNQDYGMAAGENGEVLITTNGGMTWTSSTTGSQSTINSVQLLDANTGVVVGSNGFMSTTSDGGMTWTPASLGTSSDLKAVSFGDSDTGIVVGTSGFVSYFNGSNWTNETSGTAEDLNDVLRVNDGLAVAVGDNGTVSLRGSNNTWSTVSTGVLTDLNSVTFKDDLIGYAAGDNGVIISTTDGGLSWAPLLSGIEEDFTNILVKNGKETMKAAGTDTVWAIGASGVVYVTQDGGATFDRFNIGDTLVLNNITYKDGVGYIIANNGEVFKFGMNAITTDSLSDSTLCQGEMFEVSYNASGSYNVGNIFRVELSDATGSFASPTIIGQMASTLSGVIEAEIPAGTVAGSGYRVRVTSTDSVVTGMESPTTITVLASPAVMLGNDTVVCSGNSITLDAGAGATAYSWSTGETTQTISVNATGGYVATVTGANGCMMSDSIQVTVPSAISVNLGSDITQCSGASVTLDAMNSDATFLWSTGQTSQTINVTTSGTYTVTVSSCSLTDTDTINVTFSTLPVATLGADRSVCGSETLDAGSFTSYLWSTGATTQTIVASTTNQYWVEVSNGSCTGRDTVNITVNALPTVNITGLASNYCTSTSVVLMTGTPAGGIFTGPGVTGSSFSPSAAGVGTHTITYTFTSGATGCTNSTSRQVVVSAPSTAVTFTNLKPLYCIDAAVVPMTGSPSGGSFSGSGVVGSNFNASVAGVGTHVVTYTLTAGSCVSSKSDTVVVTSNTFNTSMLNLGPDTSICDYTQLDLNAGPGFVSYLWNTGSTDQFQNVAAIGTTVTYSVTVVDTNSCVGTDSRVITVSPCTGIEETSSVSYKVYPNPSIGVFNLELDAKADGVAEIMNITGKVVYKVNIKAGVVYKTQVDLSNEANGIYLFRVVTGERTFTERLIVQ